MEFNHINISWVAVRSSKRGKNPACKTSLCWRRFVQILCEEYRSVHQGCWINARVQTLRGPNAHHRTHEVQNSNSRSGLTCAELQLALASPANLQAQSGVAEVQPDHAFLQWKVKGQEKAALVPRAELQCHRDDPRQPARRPRQLQEAAGVGERHRDGHWLSTGKGHIALRKKNWWKRRRQRDCDERYNRTWICIGCGGWRGLTQCHGGLIGNSLGKDTCITILIRGGWLQGAGEVDS